ncbi:mutator family transposase [Cryobacterium psychrophilum]|uniref:Uncharacterized protein n=1 Tax=Cryobacterium psychrophilum TaxID=41988 RepID=A0A4Y8KRP2_9MICO|nr:mutator family transposase [Cryobacterium psychrophilum]TFD82156.1 hypothetical protein E3T53_01060 [Cryobacterium psychrophilum]
MTTPDAVTKKTKTEPTREEVAAKEWVRLAQEQGLALDGPNGLLGQFTKTFLETALNEEMNDHLGPEKNRVPDERDDTNVRNGTRPKTVISPTTGPVTIQAPRDRTPDLLRRSSFAMAARHEREHQRAPSSILSQGHRSESLGPRISQHRRRRTQRPASHLPRRYLTRARYATLRTPHKNIPDSQRPLETAASTRRSLLTRSW